MSDYNLLFIEKNIRSYNLYTDHQKEDKRFNYTRVSCGVEAKVTLDEWGCEFDIIVVNNDLEDDNFEGLDLVGQLDEKIKEEELNEPPFMIVFTSRMRYKNQMLRSCADAVLQIEKTNDDDFYSQIEALLRRREKLSNADGLITRVGGDGNAKYYFKNHLIFATDLVIGSVTDQVFKHLLKEKGIAVKPINILNLVDDIKDPEERKRKAKDRARKAIHTIRDELAILLHKYYKRDLEGTKKISKEIIRTAGRGDSLTYKYNNEFNINQRAFYHRKKASSSSQEGKS